MSIPLLDLHAQYENIKEEINQAVLNVLAGGQYILGPNVKALEKEIASYCGVKYGIGVANGTDALMLSLVAYGIGPGDEVITSPFTFFASAEVISQVGARPVFVDIDANTFNIDVEKIEAKITNRTKAIIPVHIFGQMVNMDKVMNLAKRYNLIVIEDACQAIGAEYKGKKAGSIGHVGCFSFFPTKNLGGYGDGGMIVTDDEKILDKIKILRVHGSSPKYYHSMVGYNSRLDEIQAAMLRVKFRYIDEWNEKRRIGACLYNDLLIASPVVTPFVADENKSVYHLYVIRTQARDNLANKLSADGISTGVYYPVPLHLQKVYANMGYRAGEMPIVEQMCKEVLAIPLYPELHKNDIERIALLIQQSFESE